MKKYYLCKCYETSEQVVKCFGKDMSKYVNKSCAIVFDGFAWRVLQEITIIN